MWAGRLSSAITRRFGVPSLIIFGEGLWVLAKDPMPPFSYPGCASQTFQCPGFSKCRSVITIFYKNVMNG